MDRNLKGREKNVEEYILPVRFDDTRIPGLCSTIGELDAKTHTPKEVAHDIAEKLNHVIDQADIYIPNIDNAFSEFAAFVKEYAVKHDNLDFVEENEFFGLNIQGKTDRFVCSCRKIGGTLRIYFDDERTENPAALILTNELESPKPFKLINNACFSIPNIEVDMTSNEFLSYLDTEINYCMR